MPEVDLHRHLEGSIRIATMLEIARQHRVCTPASLLSLSELVQIQDEDPLTFDYSLEKFKPCVNSTAHLMSSTG